MSDCSTHAMKPKQPRTCGNCGHGVQTNVFCRESDGKTAGLHSLGERGCRKWVARGDTLEQRYERLAQVAMQMRDWLFYYVETDPGHVVVESDQDEVREIREAFDALGVSVDD